MTGPAGTHPDDEKVLTLATLDPYLTFGGTAPDRLWARTPHRP